MVDSSKVLAFPKKKKLILLSMKEQ